MELYDFMIYDNFKIMQLKEIFEKNRYDNKFFDRCLGTFLNKIYYKKDLYISSLIYGNCRFQQDQL